MSFATFHHNIPLSSRETAIFTFSEFGARQNLDRRNDILQSLWLDLVNINVYAIVIKIFHYVEEIWPFSLFQNLALGKASIDDKCHFLDLVNINVSAKFYQNIPNGLRVKFHCFQN